MATALHPASSRLIARLLPELGTLALKGSLLWASYQQQEARLRLPSKVALGLPHLLQKPLCHSCICNRLLDSNGHTQCVATPMLLMNDKPPAVYTTPDPYEPQTW